MLVIVVHDDPLFRRFVARSLEETEFEARVEDAAGAEGAFARTAPLPVVLIYPWRRPEGEASEGGAPASLRRVRAQRDRYLIATLGPGEGPSLAAAIESGADDVLVKPLTAEVLRSRLRVAAHRFALPERMVGTPREALREALASAAGGEVVVRWREHVGRIYVSEGKIAWVHLAGAPVGLGGIVQNAGVTLDEDTAAAVIDEARRLGVHFTDVLVRWGYLDEAGARECVRAVVSEQLDRILSLQGAAALFLPQARASAPRMSFAFAEVATPTIAPARLVEQAAPAEGRLPIDRVARHAACAERAARLEGACGAVVLDRSTSEAWGCAGEGIEGELAWSLLEALAALGPGAEDVLAVRRDAAIVARVLDASSALVVAFSLERTNLGLARASLKHLVELWGAAASGAPASTPKEDGKENEVHG